ncbi:unnamed protein product [Staurois parvus]|uniref:C2H2-type domain-containing protein n=1 Tax=Staurois parvus TaxID=386267 RepID=A0ABN9DY60_9NEOB|nr:unnamed protein product [Staurois parvus]
MVVRESGELISRRVNCIGSGRSKDSRGATVALKPLTVPSKGKGDESILKLTSKIIHLLTGEVRRFVRREDGSIAENSQPAPSLGFDGSSNRNPPQRCPRPLYSQDSTEEEEEEDDPIEQEDDHGDNVISIKVEDEGDPSVRGGEPCKEEDSPPEISTGGSSNGNTPERSPRPLNSRDSPQEDQEVLHHDQAENPDRVRVVIVPHAEDGDEDMKGIRTEVSPDNEGKNGFPLPETTGSHRSRTSPTWSSNELVSLEGKIYVCYECGKCIVYETDLQQEEAGTSSPLCCDCDKATPFKPFLCVKCGKSFSSKMVFMAHQSVHTGGQSFPCGECGLTFSNKSILETHQSIHTGDPGPSPAWSAESASP